MEKRSRLFFSALPARPLSRTLALLGLSAWIVAAGCDGNSDTSGPGGGGSGASGGSGGAGTTTTTGQGGEGGSAMTGGSAGSTSVTSGTGAGGPTGSLCAQEPPAGAPQPAPLPEFTGGACPDLVAGENSITSKGNARKFVLVLPADLKPDERPPILFLWHWLGGSAEDFIEQGEIQSAVDQQRFIAVVPRSKGDVQVFGLNLQWPYDTTQSDARVEEEFTFFDDMLSCVGKQFEANLSCVGTAGVSAGALFTGQLAAHRADRISSFISLSGGTGGTIRPWGKPEHKLPGIVLWGGPTDNCFNLLSFDTLSKTLEGDLSAEGNFFLECIHNCGHSAPPLDPPPDGSSVYSSLWGFFLDHPFWLKAGESPYKDNGLPPNLPEWCGIGQSSATPRVGPCSGGGC